MTFANPAFWLAGTAVAIPIVLHLIRRSTRRTVQLGTTRFLDEVLTHQSRHRQPKRLLLLLLRMAIVVLIALLFMRPSMSQRATDRSRRTDRIILVDRSPSMAIRNDQGERLLDVAHSRAKSVIAADEDGSARSVVGWFDDECNWVETKDFLEVRRPPIQWSATDYAAVLATAAAKVRQMDAPCEVTLITDLQDRGLDGAFPVDWPDRATLNVLDVHHDQVDNLSLIDLSVESLPRVETSLDEDASQAVSSPAPVQLDSKPLPRRRPTDAQHILTARISRTTDAIGEEVMVAVEVQNLDAQRDIVQSVRKTIVWDGNESETQITLTKLDPGRYAITAKLESDDQCSDDDQRETAIWVGDQLDVPIIVAGETNTTADYLVAALRASDSVESFESRIRQRVEDQRSGPSQSDGTSTKSSSRFDPRVVTGDGSLDPRRDVAIMVDPPRDGGPLASSVQRLLDDGGSVIIFLGDQMIGSGPTPAWLPQGEASLRDAGVTPYRIERIDAQDESLGTFSDFQTGNLTRLAFNRIMAIQPAPNIGDHGLGEPSDTPAHVVASFEKATPAIVRKPFGKGFVVWCYFLPDRDWGPFVSHRLFTPLVQQLVGREAGLVGDGPVRWVEAGSTAEALFPSINLGSRQLTVVTPPVSEFDFTTTAMDRFIDAFGLDAEQVEFLDGKSWRRLQNKDDRGAGSRTAAAVDADVLAVRSDGTVGRERPPMWRFLAVGLIGLLFLESLVATRTPS